MLPEVTSGWFESTVGGAIGLFVLAIVIYFKGDKW
jgi:hypothetical protein